MTLKTISGDLKVQFKHEFEEGTNEEYTISNNFLDR
jgi:hypothetical protein